MKKILLLLFLLPLLCFGQSNLKEMSNEQLLLQKTQAIEDQDDERIAAIEYELNSRMTIEQLQAKFNADLDQAIAIEDYAEAARVKKIILKISEVRSIDASIKRAVDQQDFNRAEELKKERDRMKEEVYKGTYPLRNNTQSDPNKKTSSDKINTSASNEDSKNPSVSKASNSTVVFITTLPLLHVMVDRKDYGIATNINPLIIHDMPAGQHTCEVYVSSTKRMQPAVFTSAQTEVVEFTFNATPEFILSGLTREQDDYNYPVKTERIKSGVPSVFNYVKIDYQSPILARKPTETHAKNSLVRGTMYMSGEVAGSPQFLPFYLGICTPFIPYSHALIDVRIRFAGIKYVGFSEAIQLGFGYGYDIRQLSLYGLLNAGGNMLLFNNNYETRYGFEAQIHLGARYFFPISKTSSLGIYGEGNIGFYNTPSGFSIGIAFSGN